MTDPEAGYQNIEHHPVGCRWHQGVQHRRGNVHVTAEQLDPNELRSLIAAVAHEPRLTEAMRLAEELRANAAGTQRPTENAYLLAELVRSGDDVSAIAAIHALGAIDDPLAERALIELLDEATEPFAAHAAWAMADRPPTPESIAALVRLVATGGFTAMLAERTLVGWSRIDPRPTIHAVEHQRVLDATERSRLHNLLRAVPALTADPSQPSYAHLQRPAQAGGADDGNDGIVVIQPAIHARVDRDGAGLGVGDSGGIAALLRNLGSALTDVDGIAEVITITRRHGHPTDIEPRSEELAPGHRIERIDVGAPGALTARESWVHRSQVERAFMAIGHALAGRQVVWHVRGVDVGGLAAAAAARTLGHSLVFTNSIDPAGVIDTLQDLGQIGRAGFALEDAADQHWFRMRLAECLTLHADRITRPPRASNDGADGDLDHVTVVAEGIDVTEIERAWQRLATTGTSHVTRRIIHSLPGERRHLPWLLTTGRMHPSKGVHRIIEAVSSDDRLVRQLNVVVIGGDVTHPTADEQSAIELIRRAARNAPTGLVTLTGHLPPTDISDLLARTVERGGVYVCAGDREAFGLGIIEALAAGAVVVAPVRGGASTYLAEGDLGCLCDTSSVADLRRGIQRALTMTDDEARATRARSMVRSTLTVDRMASRLGKVYRQVPSPVNA